ncbi:beta-2-glycoprotein 1-like isoform X2 [Phyllobates terribilis]|uniref:beta-2-glycoprotein 1-like isoform X2 n=1 Tax=Phyllobates terribilis TaxID=111132 RepID=UPI003CCA8BD4
MAWKIYFLIVFIPMAVHCDFGDDDIADFCPTRNKSPIGHTCQKACTKDQDCPKKRLKCFCDGECGMSCVTLVSTCTDPPSIKNGYFVKNGHLVEEALVQYKCDQGYTLEGPAFAKCLENKTWSNNVPTCKKVYCPPPPEIKEGILVAVKKADYEVSEVIYYMCKRNFFMDGSHSVTCMADGQWSDGPACRARCKVPVQRSQVIYNGQKLWVTEIDEGLVHHSENVEFFCQNKTQACSYTASGQCFDGVLSPPPCYEEPTWVQYTFFSKNLVSEISSCQEL